MFERRERLPDGTFSEPKKIGEGPTDKEKLEALGMQLAQEKLSNIEKDCIINGLGAELAQLKIEFMKLRGGAS